MTLLTFAAGFITGWLVVAVLVVAVLVAAFMSEYDR